MFYPFPRPRLLSFKNCGNASTNNYFIYKTIIIQEKSELKLPMFTLWNVFIEKIYNNITFFTNNFTPLCCAMLCCMLYFFFK